MSDVAFADFTEQALSLSYDQTIILIGKMLESLKSKKIEDEYGLLQDAVVRNHMNVVYEELKNDAW